MIVSPPYQRSMAMLTLLLALCVSNAPASPADETLSGALQRTAELARSAWENGAVQVALEILDQGIQDHPRSLALQKLRGDIYATSRRPQDAVQTYDIVLAGNPAAMDVRWAKWGVLLRSGQADEAVAELRR